MVDGITNIAWVPIVTRLRMTTGAAANPTLTIVALAMRQAEHILEEMSRGDL